jgi:hypothetical protein
VRLLKEAGTAPATRAVALASMTASSAEVGTCAGVQFAAVNQSLLAEPFHARDAASASLGKILPMTTAHNPKR